MATKILLLQTFLLTFSFYLPFPLSELNDNLQFPDGVKFYPDIKDGVRGYNTDPQRGADTFCPFRGNIKSQTVATKYTASPTSSFSYNFTFDKLTEIVGISYIGTDLSAIAIHSDESRRPKISGNTVYGQCRNNDTVAKTPTLTITAVGY